ncbi:MAG: hypothetical protein OZ935_19100 [Pseudomonadota bacterium]|nr:hypothetical protein [Pseudomonadota bacterium]
MIHCFESRNSIFVNGMRDSGLQNRVIGDGVAVRLNAMGHDAIMAGRNVGAPSAPSLSSRDCSKKIELIDAREEVDEQGQGILEGACTGT